MPDEAIESEQAMKDFSKAIESKPEYVDAHLHRGVVYIKLELPTAACDDFYQVGLLSLKESNKTKALGCVDMIKKTDPSSPLIKKLMDKIYEEQ